MWLFLFLRRLKRIGYRRGIVLGLLLMAGGALLFIPAADSRAFALFRTALAALGAGIKLLQVAANPYVSILEPAPGAANNFGGTISSLLGSMVLFGGSVALRARLAVLPPRERLT